MATSRLSMGSYWNQFHVCAPGFAGLVVLPGHGLWGPCDDFLNHSPFGSSLSTCSEPTFSFVAVVKDAITAFSLAGAVITWKTARQRLLRRLPW